MIQFPLEFLISSNFDSCKMLESSKKHYVFFLKSRVLIALREYNQADKEIIKASKIAIEFWETLASHIPEWEDVRKRKVNSSEIRSEYIHTHGITLQAIGKMGNALLKDHPDDWREKLASLKSIDWSRGNPDWEGRAMIGGKFTKAYYNIYLTSAYIKHTLGLTLTEEEVNAEETLKKIRNGN